MGAGIFPREKLIERPVDPARRRFYTVRDDSEAKIHLKQKKVPSLVNENDFVDKEHPNWPLLIWRSGPPEIKKFVGVDPEGYDTYYGRSYGIAKLEHKPVFRMYGKPPYFDTYFSERRLLISNRAKELFEEIDPDAFQFVECDAQASDRTPLPPYWMMKVTRVVEEFDEERSVFREFGGSTPLKAGVVAGVVDLYELFMRDNFPTEYHAFNLLKYSSKFIFDEAIVDAWRARGFTGLVFSPLQPAPIEEIERYIWWYTNEAYFDKSRRHEWEDLVR